MNNHTGLWWARRDHSRVVVAADAPGDRVTVRNYELGEQSYQMPRIVFENNYEPIGLRP